MPTSAYPRRYPGHWLLRQSLQSSGLRLTPASPSTSTKSQRWLLRSWCSFSVALGPCSPPGLSGVNTGQLAVCQPHIPSLLGRPIIRVGLFPSHDGSTARSLSLPIATCFRKPARRIRAVSGSAPASRIDGQSLPWGTRISLFTSAAGDCTQHRSPSCQGSSPCLPSLSSALISGERLAQLN